MGKVIASEKKNSRFLTQKPSYFTGDKVLSLRKTGTLNYTLLIVINIFNNKFSLLLCPK